MDRLVTAAFPHRALPYVVEISGEQRNNSPLPLRTVDHALFFKTLLKLNTMTNQESTFGHMTKSAKVVSKRAADCPLCDLPYSQ